jgi:integrase
MADKVVGELERLFQACAAQGDEDLVFADPFTLGPMTPTPVLDRFRRALKAAGLDERFRFHDLRHTFGTHMAAAGTAMRLLQEWMGHRDFSTTLVYADYAPNAREAQLVEAAFKRPEDPRGTSRGTRLSESEVISDELSAVNTGHAT